MNKIKIGLDVIGFILVICKILNILNLDWKIVLIPWAIHIGAWIIYCLYIYIKVIIQK